jgi:CheY-like chemotaxis protein
MKPTSLTLLVVDNDADTRYEARKALQAAGYRVIEADDGEGALQLAHQEKAALVLLAFFRKPYSIGALEVCRRLKAPAFGHALKVLLLVTQNNETEYELAKSLPADGSVIKPFYREELIAAVNGALGRN